jgi:hypothetical protein
MRILLDAQAERERRIEERLAQMMITTARTAVARAQRLSDTP